jgi:hypothetical protein
MTDRELLELAAKAAGINTKRSLQYADGAYDWPEKAGRWNPLSDDGDALRLAVKLRFSIKDFAPHDDPDIVQAPPDGAPIGMVEIWRESDDDPIYVEWYKPGFDRYAATRRAIVRAAAKLGESL